MRIFLPIAKLRIALAKHFLYFNLFDTKKLNIAGLFQPDFYYILIVFKQLAWPDPDFPDRISVVMVSMWSGSVILI